MFPNLGANAANIYEPAHGALTAIPVVASFANPMQFICSSIQAGSRLGYQESAELCAQYLAPILDAIKFNFPPFGVNMFSTPDVLPKEVAYSEDRLHPPSGYKDTTVPGILSRDTLFSHGNHEPGWIVAPGMQGVQVQAFTQNMLTPDSLAELMGGPDITSIPPAGPPGGAPPNAYDETQPAAAAVVPAAGPAAGAWTRRGPRARTGFRSAARHWCRTGRRRSRARSGSRLDRRYRLKQVGSDDRAEDDPTRAVRAAWPWWWPRWCCRRAGGAVSPTCRCRVARAPAVTG